MYKKFAQIYDLLMKSFPYDDYQEVVERLLPPRGKILDIGCGTGKMTSFFFQKGAEVHALDTSSNMLSFAKRKLPQVNFYLGTLEEMDLGSFDQVYACIDIINYYLSEKELRAFFISVKEHLKGEFFFDLRHPKAMEENLADKVFFYEEDLGDLVWINEKEGDILFQEIILYWKEEDFYIKSSEIHQQKIWSPNIVEGLLKEAGLIVREKIENTERIYYLCGLTEVEFG